MKKIIFAILALSLVSLVSCKKEDPQKCDFIGIKDSYSFLAAGNSVERFWIESNISWTITKNNLDWLDIKQRQRVSGIHVIEFTVQDNALTAVREGSFVIKSALGETTIAVSQLGAAPSVSVDSPASHNCNYKGYFNEGGKITITANCDWTINGAADWLTLSPASGSVGTVEVVITAETNMSKEARACELVINAAGSDYATKYSVKQDGKPDNFVDIDIKSVTFDGKAGEKIVNVSSTGDWIATTSADWISISPAGGADGNTDVTITVPAFDGMRTGKVTFACGSSTAVLSVEQLGGDEREYADMKVGDSFKWMITNSAANENLDWNSNLTNSKVSVHGRGLGLAYADNSPVVDSKKTVYVKWEKGNAKLHDGHNPDYNDESNYFWYGEPSNFASPALAIANGTYTDNALCFHMPVKHIDKGRVLELTFAMNATGKQPAFWNAEYSLDGGNTWVTGSAKLTVYQNGASEMGVAGSENPDNDKNDYTTENGAKSNLCVRDHFSNTSAITGKAAFTYVVTCNVLEDVSWTEVMIRIRCVDGLDTVKPGQKPSILPALSGNLHFGNPGAVGAVLGTEPMSIKLK